MPMIRKILLADDDAEMQDILAALLEHEGYEVIKAADGEEALEMAKKELPSLIMLDIHMPRMDGLTACKAIKADKVIKSIPVIMLTVEGSVREIQQAIDYGAKTYITKPSSKEEILKVIRSVI